MYRLLSVNKQLTNNNIIETRVCIRVFTGKARRRFFVLISFPFENSYDMYTSTFSVRVELARNRPTLPISSVPTYHPARALGRLCQNPLETSLSDWVWSIRTRDRRKNAAAKSRRHSTLPEETACKPRG